MLDLRQLLSSPQYDVITIRVQRHRDHIFSHSPETVQTRPRGRCARVVTWRSGPGVTLHAQLLARGGLILIDSREDIRIPTTQNIT